jgi:hypothetical protein
LELIKAQEDEQIADDDFLKKNGRLKYENLELIKAQEDKTIS